MPPIDFFTAAAGPQQGWAQVLNFDTGPMLGLERDIMGRQLALEQMRGRQQAAQAADAQRQLGTFANQEFAIANVHPNQMANANAERQWLVQEQQRLAREHPDAVIAFQRGNATPEQHRVMAPFLERSRQWDVLRQQRENQDKLVAEVRANVAANKVYADPNAEAYMRGDARFLEGGLGPQETTFDVQKAIGEGIDQLAIAAPEYASAWANADSEGRRQIQEGTLSQRRALADAIINNPQAIYALRRYAAAQGVGEEGLRDWLVEQIQFRREEAQQSLGARAQAREGALGEQDVESMIQENIEIVPDPQPRTGAIQELGRGVTQRFGGISGAPYSVTAFGALSPRTVTGERTPVAFEGSFGWNAATGRSLGQASNITGTPGQVMVVATIRDNQGNIIPVPSGYLEEARTTGYYNGQPVEPRIMQEVFARSTAGESTTTGPEGARTTTTTDPTTTRYLLQPTQVQGTYAVPGYQRLQEMENTLRGQLNAVRQQSESIFAPIPQ